MCCRQGSSQKECAGADHVQDIQALSQEELAEVLEEDPSPFEPEEVLALMRIAHLAPSLQIVHVVDAQTRA